MCLGSYFIYKKAKKTLWYYTMLLLNRKKKRCKDENSVTKDDKTDNRKIFPL